MSDSPLESDNPGLITSTAEARNFQRMWLNGLRVGHIGHSKTSAAFSSRGRVLGVATIFLSALVGAGIFSAIGSEPPTWVRILGGVCSFLASACAGVNTFLNYSELSEKHRLAATKFGSLRRELEGLLSAEDPDIEGINSVMSRWSALEEEVPPVPSRMHRAALARIVPVDSRE